MPSPEADPTPGQRWNPWEIAPIQGVDTAGIGLLRVRVWRFRRPRIPGAGSCLSPLRCVSQPTQCRTLRPGKGALRPPWTPQLRAPPAELRTGAGHRPPNPVAGAPVPERRTVIVAARVTPAEHAAWQEKAAAAGMSPSALLREAMARTRTWTAPALAVESERIRQIARIGNNLNHWLVGRTPTGSPTSCRSSGRCLRWPAPTRTAAMHLKFLPHGKGSARAAVDGDYALDAQKTGR